MKTKLLISGLALMAVTTLANAQNPSGGRGQQKNTVTGGAFVDADKNGICDFNENNRSNRSPGNRSYTGRANTQGQGQGLGQGQGQGQGLGQGQGRGSGQGQGQGRGRNRNFVDADGNGNCDNYERSVKK